MQKGLKGHSVRREGRDWKRDTKPMEEQKEERRRTIEKAIWIARHQFHRERKFLCPRISKHLGVTSDGQAFLDAHRANRTWMFGLAEMGPAGRYLPVKLCRTKLSGALVKPTGPATLRREACLPTAVYLHAEYRTPRVTECACGCNLHAEFACPESPRSTGAIPAVPATDYGNRTV
jgi:hypothetical protein